MLKKRELLLNKNQFQLILKNKKA